MKSISSTPSAPAQLNYIQHILVLMCIAEQTEEDELLQLASENNEINSIGEAKRSNAGECNFISIPAPLRPFPLVHYL